MDRLQILFILFGMALFGIVGKLFYIQAFTSDTYSTNNYLQTQRIEPTRGNIFDRNNEPIVTNQASYLLYAEPQNIDSPNDVIEELDRILHIGEATLEAKLDTKKLWVPITGDVDEKTKKKIEKQAIKGLGFNESSKRFYPEASIAAHLAGFVGKDEDGDNIGYFGIEGYYNKDLEGLPGILKTERDVIGANNW